MVNGLEVSRTPKGLPEQLAIALTYQCKLVLIGIVILYQIRTDNVDAKDRSITIILRGPYTKYKCFAYWSLLLLIFNFLLMLRARIELTFLLLQSNALTVEPSELWHSLFQIG